MSNILKATEAHFSKQDKFHLPVLKEQRFYPTEASVEMEPEFPGETKVLGTCQRAAYYRYTGTPGKEDYSNYTHWIFLTGKALEKGLLDTFKDMGVLVANNLKFNSDKYFISGEMDAVIKDPTTQELILVEAKSYYGYEATKQVCGNPKKGIAAQPKDAHLLQTLIYLYLHQHIFQRAVIIYLDKVCQNNSEIEIRLTKEDNNTYAVIDGKIDRRFAVEQIFERFDKLKEFVTNKQLPPREFQLVYSDERVERDFKAKKISKTRYENWQKNKKKFPIGDWNCNYCSMKKTCWSEKDIQDTSDDSIMLLEDM